ncbi:MAG: tRNA lysidine(34) synthetase TilS, partial [Elusimicrobiota bacterium]
LHVRREEARAYLRALKVEWVEDETNRDERRLRNRLRRRLWPLIARAHGPSAAAGAARSAARLASAWESLEATVRETRERLLRVREGRARVAPLSEARRLPQAVRAGLWRAALELARRGAAKRRSALGRHLEALDRLALEGGPSARLDLPGGLQARRGYDSLSIGPPAQAAPAPRREVPLKIPGKTLHPGLGIAVRALLRRTAGAGGPLTALLDAGRLGEGAVLRARREGDRFHPAGAPGGRKLKEYFIDRKVPREERDRVPLLAVGKEVAWVIGHQASEKFRAREDSKRLILLRAAPTRK